MPTTQRMTAEEYLALPEPLHRQHTEVINGEIVVHEPLPLHQLVKGELSYELTRWCKQDPRRSLSTWRYDIGPKKAAYERAGLRELWLVDTAASEVLIFRRSVAEAPGFDLALELERDQTLTSPQLEGFELALGELFPE